MLQHYDQNQIHTEYLLFLRNRILYTLFISLIRYILNINIFNTSFAANTLATTFNAHYYLPPLPNPEPSCEDLSSAAGQERPAPKSPPEAGDCDAAGHGVVPAGLVLLKPFKFSDILLLL
jgi:hypothetical protein